MVIISSTPTLHTTSILGLKSLRGGGCSQLAGLLTVAADHKRVYHLTAVSNTLHHVHVCVCVHACMCVCVCWEGLCLSSS